MRHKSENTRKLSSSVPAPANLRDGYDPEMLYVECGRCGAPVLWEKGRATALLEQAGVDPLELDSSCILLTDACPACGSGHEFTVRIFRISSEGADVFSVTHGHA